MKEEKRIFQKQEYDKTYRKINQLIACAIFVLLLGITGLIFGAEFCEESEMILPICWFCFSFITTLLILLKMIFLNEKYTRDFPKIPECYEEAEKKQIQKKKRQAFGVGGLVFILGLILLTVSYMGELVDVLSLLPIAIFFLCLSCILPQVAYWKLEEEKMDIARYNKHNEAKEQQKAIFLGIGLIATICITILGSILFQNWNTSFAIFCIGSIFSISLSTIIGKMRKKKKEG